MVTNGYVNFGMYWFTLALINSVLAQTKNRDGLLTFAISLLLGPVMTLLIAVERRKQPKNE